MLQHLAFGLDRVYIGLWVNHAQKSFFFNCIFYLDTGQHVRIITNSHSECLKGIVFFGNVFIDHCIQERVNGTVNSTHEAHQVGTFFTIGKNSWVQWVQGTVAANKDWAMERCHPNV